MYLSYYQLDKKPFQTNSDPDFLWLGEKHREALSILTYGVLDNKGFLLLTGEAGTGKTTLTNAFVNSLGDDVIVAQVSNPSLTKLGLTKRIAEMFGIDTAFERKDEFLSLFTTFLNQAYTDNKKVLLIIDEAQLLTHELLEEIRLLSNIERQNTKLLNILFVGQSEFKDTLEHYENRAIRQRITINYTLDPFELDGTGSCIEHRLQVAGGTKNIFSREAIEAIHLISEGFPCMINMLCDHALLHGYLQEKREISGEMVSKCANDLQLANIPDCAVTEDNENSLDDFFEESDIPPLDERTLQDLLKKSTIPPPVDAAFAEVVHQEQKTESGIWRYRLPLISGVLLTLLFALYNSVITTNPIGSFLQKDLSAAPSLANNDEQLNGLAAKTKDIPPVDYSKTEDTGVAKSPQKNMLANTDIEQEIQDTALLVNTTVPTNITLPADNRDNQIALCVENGQNVLQKPVRPEKEIVVDIQPHSYSMATTPGNSAEQPSVKENKVNQVRYDVIKVKLEPISMEHKSPGAAIDFMNRSGKS